MSERPSKETLLRRRLAPPIVKQVLATPGQPLENGALDRMQGIAGLARTAPQAGGPDLEIAGVRDPSEIEASRVANAALGFEPNGGPSAGHDFSRVRIHTGPIAAASARAMHARAYTVGNDVVFGAGEYTPQTREGQRLLAHELTHVAQQSGGQAVVQREVSFDECSDDQETVVQESHDRAMEMVQTAIDKLDAYDGTDPAEVKTAMDTHFHGTSTTLAWWLRLNLKSLKSASDSPQYECESEPNGNALGWSMWCVPFSDIELYPKWFARGIDLRARTMIHEWVHRYGCNFDLGYEHEEGYGEHSTARALLNADSWAHFVYDVR